MSRSSFAHLSSQQLNRLRKVLPSQIDSIWRIEAKRHGLTVKQLRNVLFNQRLAAINRKHGFAIGGPWIPGSGELDNLRDDLQTALAADFKLLRMQARR
jgi:hypothetical protein